jgi:hypothetical protein
LPAGLFFMRSLDDKAPIASVDAMDVHEDAKQVREAQERVAVKRRLEKWEAWTIITLMAAAIGLMASYFL